jgi:YihY family inner membrane protein
MEFNLPGQKKHTFSFSGLLTGIEKKTRPLQDFVTKFNNDWVMNQAAGLAYNLMTAIIPIAVALISFLGFTIGRLDASATTQLIQRIQEVFPSSTTTDLLPIALKTLSQKAGFFVIIAALAAIFGGSRLFISIEGYFDIIYGTAPRKVIPQNIMAILMMVAFLILIPLMVIASSLPALLRSLSQIPVIDGLPGIMQITNNGILLGIVGILSSLLICWVLFLSIYVVVPNGRMSFRGSWRGAIVAALALEGFLALFPFYVTHFMGSYTGTAGFLFILLVFFYYFAVILLLGAEVNAYFVLGICPLPNNIAVVLQTAADRAVIVEPKQVSEQETIGLSADSVEKFPVSQEPVSSASPSEKKSKIVKARPTKKTSTRGVVLEVLAGSTLAFILTMLRLRNKKT